jgi:hypothetical protein
VVSWQGTESRLCILHLPSHGEPPSSIAAIYQGLLLVVCWVVGLVIL